MFISSDFAFHFSPSHDYLVTYPRHTHTFTQTHKHTRVPTHTLLAFTLVLQTVGVQRQTAPCRRSMALLGCLAGISMQQQWRQHLHHPLRSRNTFCWRKSMVYRKIQNCFRKKAKGQKKIKNVKKKRNCSFAP